MTFPRRWWPAVSVSLFPAASGFRSEIDEERRLAQLCDIVEMYEDWKAGIIPGGPMRPKLTAEFVRVRSAIGDLPGSIVDDRRRVHVRLSSDGIALIDSVLAQITRLVEMSH